MRCSFCQNWQISQWPKEQLPKSLACQVEDETLCPLLEERGEEVPGEPVTPQIIVAAAVAAGATSIAYTYTEPTIFYELAHDTAVLAREQGLRDVAVTPVDTLHRAARIGREAGLHYVYEGNVPGEQGENTNCHHCCALLIERYGFHLLRNRVRQGACPDCGTPVAGVGLG